MYIRQCVLNNFRKHELLTVPLDRINVVLGPNGAGKTSILEAISYAMWGETASGVTKNELMKLDAKSGYVQLDFDSGYTLYRELGKTSKIRLSPPIGSTETVLDRATDVESWLRISKAHFMDLLYAPQGEIYHFFLKFTKNQKEFIDNLVIPDPALLQMQQIIDKTRSSIETEVVRLRAQESAVVNGQQYIASTLSRYNVTSLDELKGQIVNIDAKLASFIDVRQFIQLRDAEQNLRLSHESVKLEYDRAISAVDGYDEQIEASVKTIASSLEQLSGVLQRDASQIPEPELRQMVAERCDITTYLNQIKSLCESAVRSEALSVEYAREVFNYIASIIDFIKNIDSYKAWFSTTLQQLALARQSHKQATYNSEQKRLNIERFVNMMAIYEQNIVTAHAAYVEHAHGISNLDEYMSMQTTLLTQRQDLLTAHNNVLNYQNMLAAGTAQTAAQIGVYQSQLAILEETSGVFHRDGFISDLRSQIMREFATNFSSVIESYGFDDLLPITVTEDGQFLFGRKTFRMLSGGQRMVSAIAQRLIYARMLAPTMRVDLIGLDEPTSELDGQRVVGLRDYLSDLSERFGMQMIIVTHDENLIPADANVIYVGS